MGQTLRTRSGVRQNNNNNNNNFHVQNEIESFEDGKWQFSDLFQSQRTQVFANEETFQKVDF